MMDIKKLLDSERLTLESEDIAALKQYIEGLRTDAECVKAYRGELLDRLSDSLSRKGIELEYDTAKSIADKLSITEIRALLDAAGEQQVHKAAPQLCPAQGEIGSANTEFRIKRRSSV